MNKLTHDSYTVGWICALPIEMAAAKLMLDQNHPILPKHQKGDHNSYAFGEIAGHNVVIACLPGGIYGTTSAAIVAQQMLMSFTKVRFGLMVGVGGGVPSTSNDVRLGDIVVSKPTDQHSGVIQYDYGKTMADGKFHRTGSLNRIPQCLLTAMANLQSDHQVGKNSIPALISDALRKSTNVQSTFSSPGSTQDQLFPASYNHQSLLPDCTSCDKGLAIPRPIRDPDIPQIHYGLIASGNQVMRNGALREQLRQEMNMLCFEMEAAGLMDHFLCLVVRGICDYADSHKGKQWQGYAAMTAAAYAKELLSVIPVTETTQEVLSNDKFRIPFELTNVPVVNKFIGRTAELDHMWEMLRPNASGLRKVVVLHGMGGIGKTQLAIHFARRQKDAFTALFWVNGEDEDTLISSLAGIAPRLRGRSEKLGAAYGTKTKEELRQAAQHVLKWLSQEQNCNWLLIYDNVDQYSPHSGDEDQKGAYDISEYFPSADQGSIIITTRLQQLTELGTFSYPLKQLPFSDGLELLRSHAGHDAQAFTSPMIDAGIHDLARRLDGLPLAIVLAGSFIRRTGMSYRKYLDHYNQAWCDLQAAAPRHRGYSNGNMLTVWKISYNEIKERSPWAARLLYLLSFFFHDDIWYELVQNGLLCRDPPRWFSEVVSTEIRFSKAIEVLLDLSLIQQQLDTGGYSLHPVVQDWCKHELPKIDIDLEGTEETNWTIVAVATGYSVPSLSEEKDFWILQRRLLPHANRICESLKNELRSSQDRELLSALHSLGRLFWSQGRLKEAEEMYERALTGREKVLGPDDISTLDTVHNIGVLYHDQGRLDEAEKMYQRALTGCQKVLGPDHLSTLSTVQNLGNLYKDQQEWKEAEEMYQQALTGYKEALDPDHNCTLNVINDLGNLYWSQGKLIEAKGMFQQAYNGWEKTLAHDHPSTLGAINNLGAVYQGQGQSREAEERYQQALAGFKRILGPDHPSTLSAFNNLGRLYKSQGKLKEAEEMYLQVLTGKENSLGPDHFSTISTVHTVGVLYWVQGKLNEAEKMYQRALAGRENTLGPDHKSTLHFVHNLAILYHQQGRLQKAEELFQRILGGQGDPSSEDTSKLDVINNLGNVYRDQGRLKEAMEMFQQVYNSRERLSGQTHPSTLGAMNNLGLVYQDQGKLEDAEEMFQQAYNGWAKTLGLGDPSTLGALNNLGLVYKDQGKLEEAKEMLQQALVGYEQSLGKDHVSTLAVANDLSNLDSDPGKLKEPTLCPGCMVALIDELARSQKATDIPRRRGPSNLLLREGDEIHCETLTTLSVSASAPYI